MRFNYRRPIFALAAVVVAVLLSRSSTSDTHVRGHGSFRFEPNAGQFASEAKFFARGKNASVFLTGEQAVVLVSQGVGRETPGVARAAQQHMPETETAVLQLQPVEANPVSRVLGLDPLPGKTNYFFGNDPDKWVTDVTGYARVKYESVYPGIDLIYYGNEQSRLEYDFVVHPGADPDLISLDIEGADDIRLDPNGDLVIQTALGDVRQQAPRVYQTRWGFEQEIPASYTLSDDGRVAFKFGNYDTRRELVIDPQLVFTTLLGGAGAELLANIGVDTAGNIYAGGHTTSLDFPIAGAVVQGNKTSSNRSVWISKMNPTGTQLIYSTYLGGTGDDPAFRLAVDPAGNAYVSGATNSSNFPIRNGFQLANAGGYDAFLAKLSPSGNTLLYSSFIGGSGFDNSQGVAPDNNGNVWVSGMTASDNFPTRNPTQATRGGGFDSFTIRIDTNQAGSPSVGFSTYYGGNGDDNGAGVIVDGGIALDGAGNTYATGTTLSTNLPTRNPFQATYGGGTDFFVVKRDSAGAIVYATYFGGSAVDASFGITADGSGNAYVAGVTLSTNYPTRNPYQATIRGGADAAIAKFDASGGLAFSTYLGGTSDESAQRIAVDLAGNMYFGGNTSSSNFPTTSDRLQTYGGGTGDGWIAQLDASGATLVFSSFIGGSGGEVTLGVALDSQGGIYVGGYGDSTLFPTTSGVVQAGNRGGQDAFLIRLIPSPKTSITLSIPGGGVATGSTLGASPAVQAGYAAADVTSGPAPYGTAVFSLTLNGAVVSEAGVPSSPPTTSARIFIDFRTGAVVTPGSAPVDINTGLALANTSTSAASVTYTLRDLNAQTIVTGTGTLPGGAHRARFIDQFNQLAPNFNLPANFSTVTRFGTLEITSSQALSIVALRLTVNQRGETLLTSTPVADLTKPQVSTPAYFPQLVDGGGYNTAVILLNTSSGAEAGSLRIFADDGSPLAVRAAGQAAGTTIPYSIPAGGAFVFETDGSPATVNVGWVQLTPTSGSTPSGAGVFRLSQGGVVVTESGVPAATPTTRARIYVDKSAGHDTGLAIGNPGGSTQSLLLTAFQSNGTTTIGSATASIPANGHVARFAGQFIPAIPPGFTGVLEISAPTPFAALTLRSLTNVRGEFLLTTFPIADMTQPAPQPVVFPQIADGGGYATQFILLSQAGSVSTTVRFLDDNGAPLGVGR